MGIKDMRNKRAHDLKISARDCYRLSDHVQQFFEAIGSYPEVTREFKELRLQAL